MDNILKKIVDYIKNNLIKISLIIIVVFFYALEFVYMYYLVNTKCQNQNNINLEKEVSIDLEKTVEKDEMIEEYIYVDVKGSVKKPNVYKLLKGSRVNDAIKEAGGLSKNANTRFINLSKLLNDGDVVVIYSNTEIKNAKKTNTIYVETPCVCEEIRNDACYNENSSSNNLININTATLDELMTLSGIGESKAKAIIEYRNTNGNFQKIEDIVNVSGISETIYDKIKNYITI